MRNERRDSNGDIFEHERGLIATARQQAAQTRDRAAAARGSAWAGSDSADVLADATGDPLELLRDLLPGYELQREIHRGGQGVVYQALQKSTRRQVAIKVMKEGPFAGADDKARFDREVRILGQLNHPSIVAIHDSGTAVGCFYFVMNYVAGSPLDVYMRTAALTLNQTLELFVKICDAVNAAHLRGIIHRDLKPSNIRIDTDGQPHVLDFGLAKMAEGSSAPGETILPSMTQTGQFIGSLPWASPEQASPQTVSVAAGVDIRTDVYSLGVMLHEMLSGTFPYDVRGNTHDIVQRILHVEPSRPSRAARGNAARFRINDEIDTIVLKCLRKDRERRYQNAGELARDIRHYLAGEPIEARGESTWYVLRKMMRRHSLVFGSAAAMVVLLAAGLVSSLTLWGMAAHARDEARAAQVKEKEQREFAERARAEEARQREIADNNRHVANAVTALVTDALVSSDPHEGGAQGRLVTSAMDEIVAQLDADKLKHAPRVEISLRLTISKILNGNGRSEDAMRVAEKALEIAENTYEGDHRDVAAAWIMIGGALFNLNRQSEALPKFETSLAILRRVAPAGDTDVVTVLCNIGACLQTMKQYRAALAKFSEAWTLVQALQPGDSDDAAQILHNIGSCANAQGDPAEALAKYEASFAMQRRLSSRDSTSLAQLAMSIGVALQSSRRYEEALARFDEALQMLRRLVPADHPLVVNNLSLIAKCLGAMGRTEESLDKLKEVLEAFRRIHRNDHFETVRSLNDVAATLRGLKRFDEALAHFRLALEMNQRLYPGDHRDVAMAMNNIAHCLQAMKDYPAAIAMHESARDMRRRLDGEFSDDVAWSTIGVATCLELTDRQEEALDQFAAASRIYRRLRMDDHHHPLFALRGEARVLGLLGRHADAEPILLEAVRRCEKRERLRDTYWSGVVGELIKFYDVWDAAETGQGHDAQAAEWRVRLADFNAAQTPPVPRATETNNGVPSRAPGGD